MRLFLNFLCHLQSSGAVLGRRRRDQAGSAPTRVAGVSSGPRACGAPIVPRGPGYPLTGAHKGKGAARGLRRPLLWMDARRCLRGGDSSGHLAPGATIPPRAPWLQVPWFRAPRGREGSAAAAPVATGALLRPRALAGARCSDAVFRRGVRVLPPRGPGTAPAPPLPPPAGRPGQGLQLGLASRHRAWAGGRRRRAAKGGRRVRAGPGTVPARGGGRAGRLQRTGSFGAAAAAAASSGCRCPALCGPSGRR